MGIKAEEFIEDELFTGEALDLRFPDYQDERKRTRQLWIITFPDWVHKMGMNGEFYDVLGKDLQIGMAFSLNGDLLPIIDIRKQLYHGLKVQEPQLGAPCDSNEIPRYNFKRVVDQEGFNRWEISPIENSTK